MVRISFEETPAEKPVHGEAPTVVLTESAAHRVANILKKQPEGMFLRIGVKGGGCNGMNYTFKFDDSWQPDDIAVEKDGVTVAIDMTSYHFMKGSTIDFIETLESSQFVIKNPNATSECGCGSSFGI